MQKKHDSALIPLLVQALHLNVIVMKSGKKQFLSHPDVSENRIPGQPMDRRRFLQYAAGVGAVVGLGGSAFGQAQQGVAKDAAQPKTASADSRLPDGAEYVSWEQPLTFSKTYYVDNNSARADDNGPGTRERPFRTINQAAQV